ncbi:MAG: hypothetical protein PHY03_02960 [Dehalococcoidia bacterium]|nr:hypothetical protein [Dehalococcoidia bacterium]
MQQGGCIILALLQMFGRIKTPIFVSLILLVTAICLTCSQQPQMQPASFQVVSLGVTPEQVLAGEEAAVIAQVTNTGGLPGNFTAELTMNGEKVAARTITIQPEKIAKVTFNVSRDKPGIYKIQLDSASTILTVTAVEERDIELKYDSGVSQDALWAGYNNGFLIHFSPPAKPFILKKVSICGGIYGVAWEGKTFELSVLDMFNTPLYKQVYAIAKFPVKGAFPYQEPSWVDFDIPPLPLENDFQVYLFTGTGMHKGIHVGVDDSIINEHSDLASGRPPNISPVDIDTFYNSTFWYSDRSKVNWMIRATGSARMPVE